MLPVDLSARPAVRQPEDRLNHLSNAVIAFLGCMQDLEHRGAGDLDRPSRLRQNMLALVSEQSGGIVNAGFQNVHWMHHPDEVSWPPLDLNAAAGHLFCEFV